MYAEVHRVCGGWAVIIGHVVLAVFRHRPAAERHAAAVNRRGAPPEEREAA